MEISNQITHMLFGPPTLGPPEERVIGQIEELQRSTLFRMHGPHRWHGWLRRMTFSHAVRGSNSIEGFSASLEDAMAIDLDEEPMDAAKATHQALSGYRSALTYILQLAGEPSPLYSNQLLKGLHFMMVGHDIDDRPGRWRAGDIFVRDDSIGAVVYQGPDVDVVDPLMQALTYQLNSADRIADGPALGEVLVDAAMAHLNLVMIHPFKDGNGRMARALQTLVLTRGGIGNPIFSSIEEYIGANTRAYYDVLQAVGGRQWNPTSDTRPWVRFVLTAHLRQARRVQRRIREAERLWDELEQLVLQKSLPERTLDALAPAAWGFRVRAATYRAAVGSLSASAAGRDLRRLADGGLLIVHGDKRGRMYLGAPVLRRMREAVIADRDPERDQDPFA